MNEYICVCGGEIERISKLIGKDKGNVLRCLKCKKFYFKEILGTKDNKREVKE